MSNPGPPPDDQRKPRLKLRMEDVGRSSENAQRTHTQIKKALKATQTPWGRIGDLRGRDLHELEESLKTFQRELDEREQKIKALEMELSDRERDLW